ncbi:histidine--tRNA ligase [Candidatus Uhrbacteria bacterium]|nr:histidine--tRNA ligase [Candidatus Uhrbacteria bacterium]
MKPNPPQPPPPAATTPVIPPKKVERVQSVRGMKDILPQDESLWMWVLDRARACATAYSFQHIETPIVEETSLFVRVVGKETDIVEKEMFSFVDQGGDHLSLRPEWTAGMVRAYLEHGMQTYPQPVALYGLGPVFRHERPQAGRLREHHQFDCEVFGEGGPVIDAQLILLARNFYAELGLETTVQMNSVGCPTCRPPYTEELIRHYRARKKDICEDCQRRLLKNPLRLLDCKVEACQGVRAAAPQLLDRLCDVCKNHFIKVLEYLDDAAVTYQLQPFLVRGLDYYTKTVFEFVATNADGTSTLALGGGGRYDGLIEQLAGRVVPASGFALGLERVISALRSRNIQPPLERRVDVFLAQLGDAAKRRALLLFEEFRKAGITAQANFAKDSLKAQLELARRANVRYTVIIGQKEVMEGTVLIRDMDGGSQEIANAERVVQEVKKKLEHAAAEPLVVVPPTMSEASGTPSLPHARTARTESLDDTAARENDSDVELDAAAFDGAVSESGEESFKKGGDDGGSETKEEREF